MITPLMSHTTVYDPAKDVPQATGALLQRPDGALLLQHRDNIPTIAAPNQWSLFGGHLEAGETPDICLVREVKEEINFQVTHYQWFLCLERTNFIFWVFLCPIQSDLSELTLTEGQGMGYFQIEEALKTLSLTPAAQTALKALLLYKHYREQSGAPALFS